MSDLARHAERDRIKREGLRQGRIEGVAEARAKMEATLREALRVLEESGAPPEVWDTLTAVLDWMGSPGLQKSLSGWIQGYLEYGRESREIERETKPAAAPADSKDGQS